MRKCNISQPVSLCIGGGESFRAVCSNLWLLLDCRSFHQWRREMVGHSDFGSWKLNISWFQNSFCQNILYSFLFHIIKMSLHWNMMWGNGQVCVCISGLFCIQVTKPDSDDELEEVFEGEEDSGSSSSDWMVQIMTMSFCFWFDGVKSSFETDCTTIIWSGAMAGVGSD